MIMQLQISHEQKLVMTQQMLLAVKILQMSAYELENYLTQEALENPLVDLELPEPDEEPCSISFKALEQADMVTYSNTFKSKFSSKEIQPHYARQRGSTLRESLLFQLIGFDAPPLVEQIVRYLIESLDESGYLTVSKQQILAELGCSRNLLEKSFNILYQMEPPGVGAANLRECLLIQAKRIKEPNPILIQLIEKYLDILKKNRLDKLAAEMGVNIEELKKAKEELLSLNPKPGNGFSQYSAVPYICPDLIVVPSTDGFQVKYNDFSHPKIELSRCYQDLAKHADFETAIYIRSKIVEAKNLISNVNQRKISLLNCAQAILHRQIAFFKNGPGYLTPMILADVAGDLGLNKSTISRAVRGKYIQSRWGVQPLSELFSHSVSKACEQKSYDMALAQIKHIIAQEDPSNPLSDQKIVQQLDCAGITISRRTVSKYREQAQIPSAAGRKQF